MTDDPQGSPATEAVPESRQTVARARRTVAIASAITVGLIVVKAIAGAMSNAAALLADALHSVVDLVALGASWFGLKLAEREPTRRFPYGFYRAESLAALLASAVILFLGVELLRQGIHRLVTPTPLRFSGLAMAVALLSAVVAFVVSAWLKRVAAQTNSQSLATTGDEARMDSGTSCLVFVGLLASHYGILRADAVIAILFSGLVLWIGARNSWTNLLSLMDASVDRQLEQDVTDTLMEISGIRGTHKLRARRAGPFYFVEGHVHVPAAMDVNRSHALVHEAAQAVRQRRREVEGVILHVEPYKGAARRILVPIVDNTGLSSSVAAQFGRAPWFLVVTLENGEITSTRTDRNTYVDAGVPVGLAAANHYSKEVGVDVVLVKEIGEVAYHAWQEHFGEVFKAGEGTAEVAITKYAQGELPRMPRPQPASDERLE